MKIFRFLIILLVLLYLTLMCLCSSKDAHEHDNAEVSQSEQDHEHEQGEEHTEEQGHVHEQESGQEQEVEQTGFEAMGISEEELLDSDLSEWERLIGLETARVERMELERVITVPGQIIPNQNQIAIVSPFIEASINCAFVNVGDRVNEGDELACLTSPEIGILRAEYDKAKAELDIRKKNYERQSKLYNESIISKRAFQQAELEKNITEVNFNYAGKKLLAIGVSQKEIDEPPTGHSHAVGSTIHIHSPISGVITERFGSIGQKVNPSHRLFEIINLSNVWCEANIFEKDLTRIEVGQTVHLKVSAYQHDYFTGKIFYIGSTLDPVTKTINILVEIRNKMEKLKPGMFTNTNIVIGKKANTLVIPKEAILEDEGLQIVFVKEPQGYHRHVVQTGIVSDPYIEILSGVTEGNIVVTKGNYQLKSKLKMSGVDPHAGHVH